MPTEGIIVDERGLFNEVTNKILVSQKLPSVASQPTPR